MKWVLNFIKEYNFRYWIANIIIIIGSIVGHVIPVTLLGVIVDEGIYQSNFSIIPSLFLYSVIICAFGRLMTYVGILILDTVRFNMASKFKIEGYKKLNQLDQSFYDKTSIGELVTLLTTDVHTIHHNMCFVVKQSMGVLMAGIASIIYSLFVSPVLTITFLIPAPIIIVLSNKYIKESNRLYKEQREILSNLNGYIQENIEGNRLVKNLGTEEYEIENFNKKTEQLKSKSLEIQNKNISYNNKVEFLSICMKILLFAIGGFLTIKGYTTLGEFIVINSLMSRITKPFTEMSGFVNEWQEFKVAVQRMKTLFQTKSKIKDNGTILLIGKNHTITLDNVSVTMNDKEAIKNINLTIEPGRTYAFIGQIGSGKSTIGKLLLRLIEPTNGNIQIDNNNIQDYTLETLRNNFGYVPQTPFLFSDTIYNNVSFGNANLDRKEIHKYLKLAKAEFIYELPNDIDTIIGENGVSLSGGEKQRLQLARALAKKPSILILDDITSALDFETELEVTNNINELNYSCTKIIIAQKILSVKNTDEIFVMKDGEIKERGNHEELLLKNGIYKEIYDIQTKKLEETV